MQAMKVPSEKHRVASYERKFSKKESLTEAHLTLAGLLNFKALKEVQLENGPSINSGFIFRNPEKDLGYTLIELQTLSEEQPQKEPRYTLKAEIYVVTTIIERKQRVDNLALTAIEDVMGMEKKT
jgi:hypothetical protein